MKRKIINDVAVIGSCVLLLLSGCSKATATTETDQTATVSDTIEAQTEENVQTQTTAPSTDEQNDTDAMFTDRDKEIGYDEGECFYIQLSDTESSCDSASVSIHQQTVTITEEGSYLHREQENTGISVSFSQLPRIRGQGGMLQRHQHIRGGAEHLSPVAHAARWLWQDIWQPCHRQEAGHRRHLQRPGRDTHCH